MATVDKKTGKVKFKNPGQVTITACADKECTIELYSYTFNVEQPKFPKNVPVSLSKGTVSMNIADIVTGVSDETLKHAAMKSTKQNVARVDVKTGNVYFNTPGKSKIYLKFEGVKKKYKFTVKVAN